MSSVAGIGALSTATVAVHNATRPALKDVLTDVFLTRPREGAAVIMTENEEGGVIRVAGGGKQH